MNEQPKVVPCDGEDIEPYDKFHIQITDGGICYEEPEGTVFCGTLAEANTEADSLRAAQGDESSDFSRELLETRIAPTREPELRSASPYSRAAEPEPCGFGCNEAMWNTDCKVHTPPHHLKFEIPYTIAAAAQPEPQGTERLKEIVWALVLWDKRWPKQVGIVAEYGSIEKSEGELNEICKQAAEAVGAEAK